LTIDAYISKSDSAMTDNQASNLIFSGNPLSLLQILLIRNFRPTLCCKLYAWKQSTKLHVQFGVYEELTLLLEDQSGDNARKPCEFFGYLCSL